MNTFRQIATEKIAAEFRNSTITSTPLPPRGLQKDAVETKRCPWDWAEMLGAAAAAVFMEVKFTYIELTRPGGAIQGHLGHSQCFDTSTFCLFQNISIIQKKPAPITGSLHSYPRPLEPHGLVHCGHFT